MMNRVFTRLSFGLALAVSIGLYLPSGMLRADEPTTQPAPPPADGAKIHKDHEGLEHNMERMGKDFKKLKSQVSDASKNTASVALAADMQKCALAAKDQVPPMAHSIPADKRDKFISDYKDMMDGLVEQCKDMQQQLTDGKNDAAADTIKSITEMMKEGHKEFRKPEHEGGQSNGHGHHDDDD